MYLKGFWNFNPMPNDNTFSAFLCFQSLGKKTGLSGAVASRESSASFNVPFLSLNFYTFPFLSDLALFFFSFSRVLHNTILSLVVFVFFLRLYFTGLSMVPHISPLYLSSLCPSFMHSAFLDFCCLRKPFQPFISYLLSYFSL